MKFYGTSRESWKRFHAWEARLPSEPFEVFLRGRETALGTYKFQALAEEVAREAATRTGRESYVVDVRKGVYAEPVFRVKKAATSREP